MARRLKGEGSLYQTKDKTCVCQYYGDDGKRHTKRFQRKVDGRAFLDDLRQNETAAMLPEQPTTLSTGNRSSEFTVRRGMDGSLVRDLCPAYGKAFYLLQL